LLNAEIKVHSNNAVQIGVLTLTPPSNTGFEVTVSNKAVIKHQSPPPLYTDPVEFQFSLATDITPGPFFTEMRSVMALTGLSDRGASIGRSNNQMNRVFSREYFSSNPGLGIQASSDANLKTNIRELSSITERVAKLRPVMYDFTRSGSGEDVSKDETYKNRVGFIAQEVLELFPDLVTKYRLGEDEKAEELLALDYAGLIPYLTKTIQELLRVNQKQSELNEKLQQQITDIQTGVFMATFDVDVPNLQKMGALSHKETSILHQNVPNPFSNATTITYQLGNDVKNAKICIYNLTGKQLQCHELPATKGENSIEIRASSLQSGMYLYSLIVDGRLIDTKRMVLTE
jgi:hypothetical protein